MKTNFLFHFTESSYRFGYPIWLNAIWNKDEKKFIYLHKNETLVHDSFMYYDVSISKIKDRKSIGAMVIAKFDSKGKFTLQQSKADSSKAITICRASPKVPKGIQTLNIMLHPVKAEERNKQMISDKDQFFRNFENMNISRSYDKLFELLWYTRLPCFDVKGITSNQKDEMSLIKRCYWRGKMVDCGKIFVARPTDRGMCCAFNFDNAEKVFKKTMYTDALVNMQNKDRKRSFDDAKNR